MKLLNILLMLIFLSCDTITEGSGQPKSNNEKLITKWEYIASEKMTKDSIISVIPMKDNGTLDFRSNGILYSKMVKSTGEVILDSANWNATESTIMIVSFDQDTVTLGYTFVADTLKTSYLKNEGEIEFDYFIKQ